MQNQRFAYRVIKPLTGYVLDQEGGLTGESISLPVGHHIHVEGNNPQQRLFENKIVDGFLFAKGDVPTRYWAPKSILDEKTQRTTLKGGSDIPFAED